MKTNIHAKFPGKALGERRQLPVLSFNLVELLIVISIISILFTLLLPALKKSMAFADQIRCTGNLKQMSTGVLGYVDDNYGYTPPADSGLGGTDYWYLAIKSYCNSKYPSSPGIYRCGGYNLGYGINYISFSYGRQLTSIKKLSTVAYTLDATSWWISTNRVQYIATRHRKGVNFMFLDGHVSWGIPVTPEWNVYPW